MFERPADCGPFECGGSSTYVPSPSSASSNVPSRASTRRTGSRWTLANKLTSLTIDTARGCRVDYSLPNRAPSSVVFDTPRSDDGVPTCVVRERSFAGGAALELSWVSARWTQQVVLSLGDAASLAQSTIARNTLSADGASIIEFTNLSPSPRTWNVGGRDLTLDPGGMVRVRTNATDPQ